jgi:hypothetical protein
VPAAILHRRGSDSGVAIGSVYVSVASYSVL